MKTTMMNTIINKDHDLTQLQEEIIYAIRSLNLSLFVDLGGCGSVDLDFEVNKNGDFPLGIACACSTSDIVKLILQNPSVDPHRTNAEGANCFWLACEAGKHEVLPHLVGNYLVVTNDGHNSLHCAVKGNHKKVVEYLIGMKFPLNIRVKDGVTALTLAAERGHFEIVQMLVEAGANINKLSNKGLGPLYKAIEANKTEVAHYLVEKGAKMVLGTKYRDLSPLFLVIKTQNVEMLQKFKKYDVDLTAKTSTGQNPLQYAANLGLTTIMNYLIKRMPNLDQEDYAGFTIFSKYILMEKLEICQKLIESG